MLMRTDSHSQWRRALNMKLSETFSITQNCLKGAMTMADSIGELPTT